MYNGPERKARMSFDVTIDGPILHIPKHAFSPLLVIGDIGHLTVTNNIRYDGEEGTFSYAQARKGVGHNTSGFTSTATESSSSSCSTSRTSFASGGNQFVRLSPQASTLSTLTSVSATTVKFESKTSLQVQGLGWSHSASLVSSVRESHSSHSENGIFGSGHGDGVESVIEEDRRRVERLLEVFRGPCLLDCIEVVLSGVDVFSAKRVPAQGENFRIERGRGNVLKEKGAAKLYIQRNLYEDFCREGAFCHSFKATILAVTTKFDYLVLPPC